MGKKLFSVFVECSSVIYSGARQIFWPRRIKRMLLVGVMLCMGGAVHCAAASEVSSEEDEDTEQIFVRGGACAKDTFGQLSVKSQNEMLARFLGYNGNNVQQAFFYAVKNNLVWAIQPLVDRGADICAHQSNQTALMMAALSGNIAMVEELIAVKRPAVRLDQFKRLISGNLSDFKMAERAEIDHCSHINIILQAHTALSFAAGNGHLAVVEFLLDRGARIDLRYQSYDGETCGQTALMCAARNGDAAIVNLLLHRNASVNVTDKYKKTALMMAATRGYAPVVDLLIAARANMETRSNEMGMTALLRAARNGCAAAVDALITAKAEIDTFSLSGFFYADGKTALMWAVSNGDAQTAQLLINAGADVGVANGIGQTAFTLAVEGGDIALIQALMGGYCNRLVRLSVASQRNIESQIRQICGVPQAQGTMQRASHTLNGGNDRRSDFEQLPNTWLQSMTEYLPLSTLKKLRTLSKTCRVISQDQFETQLAAQLKGAFQLEQEEKCKEFIKKEIGRARVPNSFSIAMGTYDFWQAAVDTAHTLDDKDADSANAGPASALSASESGCAIA